MAEREKEGRSKDDRRDIDPPPFRPDPRLVTYINKPQGQKHPKVKQ